MSFRHIRAMTLKEIQHILRDRLALFLVILSPVVMLMIMSYALTVSIQHVPVAVLDYDRSAVSRSFVQQLTAGDDLDLVSYVQSIDEIEKMLFQGEVKAALIIHPAFSHELMSLQGMPIQIIIDGTEPESGGFAVEYIVSRALEYFNAAAASGLQAHNITLDTLQPIDLRVRSWYNPSLKPEISMIPGLISMVLGLPALSVALTLAREREHGTMEQLLATPISRTDLLLGKVTPYVIVGLSNVFLLPLIAMFWFKVPFNGSFALFFMLSVLFLFSILTMGVLIGVFMRTQAAALALSFLVIFFPGFFLTGIFFPTVAMPEELQLEAMFLPGTHYAVITRGIFLPGVGLEVLWPYAIMLLILWLAFTALAVLFFKKRIA